jgi:hypothetical protein
MLRMFAALSFLVVTPAALAQVGSSPVGLWELKVGGTFDGEKVNGIAYLEFESDGTLSGYYLNRLSYSVAQVEGSWSQQANQFSGAVDVEDENGPVASFDMIGKAKASKSLSAKLTDEFGSQVKISGKALGLLPGLEGTYAGVLRQYGYQASVEIELVPDQTGAYVVSGSMTFGSDTYVLSGYVVALRNGQYVAFIENQTQGLYSSIWGKIKPGRAFNGAGISLDDGSSIKVAMTPTG